MLHCEHAMPGRLRLKAAVPSPEKFRSLRQSLLDLPGVRAVDARPLTGSLIIHHDASIDQALLLAHAGVVPRAGMPLPGVRQDRLEEALANLVVETAMEYLLGKPAMTLLKAIL